MSKLTVIAVLLVALATGPADAAGAQRNLSSTSAYLRANYVFLRTVRANEGKVDANVTKLDSQFAAQCPRVGTGAPQNEAAQHVSYEVAGALWYTLYHTDAAAVARFVRAVKPLHWSNGSITRAARRYVASLHELAELPLPDLCGDVRAWSASGFKTVPLTTLDFDRHLEAIEGKAVPARLLSPYERPADKRLAARDERLETELEHTETIIGFDDWDRLLETLSLNQ